MTKTYTKEIDLREIRARLNQLYLRRTIVNDVIGHLERYQSWLGRTSAKEAAPRSRQLRYKRVAA